MNETAVKALMAEIAPVIRDYYDHRASLDRETLEPRLKAIENRPSPEKGDPGEPGKDAPAGPTPQELYEHFKPFLRTMLEEEHVKFQERQHQLTRAQADAEWNARIKRSLGDDYPTAEEPEDNDLGQS